MSGALMGRGGVNIWKLFSHMEPCGDYTIMIMAVVAMGLFGVCRWERYMVLTGDWAALYI